MRANLSDHDRPPGENHWLYGADDALWPALDRTTPIIIFGNFGHFAGSALYKTLTRYGLTPQDGFALFAEDRDALVAAVANAVLLKWEPLTRNAMPHELREIVVGQRIINDTHLRNFKDNVHRHFQRSFGYPIDIDPTRYAGLLVEKSKENALHDGNVVMGPVTDVDPTKVYMRLIANDVAGTEGEWMKDLRVPIFGGYVPFVYLKWRRAYMRFQTDCDCSRICETREVLSAAELRTIAVFAHSIGLDYGELDVLRDRADGRIYVVDVNNTPYGPPSRLLPGQEEQAFTRQMDAFARVFL